MAEPARTIAVAVVLWSAFAGSPGAEAPALDGQDLLHGLAQVDRMLADRPELRSVLIDQDPLRTWAAARFAGSGSDRRVFWSGQYPPEGIEAQSQLEPRPTIRVHPIFQHGPLTGQEKPAADLWADVVFELHNVAQAHAVSGAWQKVLAGTLSHAGWLEAVTRGEHRALLFSRAFYRTRWRAWMRRRSQPHLSYRWRQIMAVPTQYEAWLANYHDPNAYPYADYGRAYRAVMDELRAAGRDWSINPFELHDVRPPREATGSDRQ